MNEYDVIVCGGGPSGAATAFYAAKAGMKVLVIDKSKFPRDKACGGLLTARLFDELPELEPYIKPIIECASNDVNLYSPPLNSKSLTLVCVMISAPTSPAASRTALSKTSRVIFQGVPSGNSKSILYFTDGE
jgi:monoamine oxidase